MALTLLFASLPGPWLTIALPAGLAFALFDRRLAARAGGAVVVALVAAVMLSTRFGGVMLATGAAVAIVSGAFVARGDGQLGLDMLAAPALATAGIALIAVMALAGEAVAAWEAALERGVLEGGRRAVEQYRAFGMGAESLDALAALSGDVAAALIAVWPALVALALWLGAWLGLRLLGRWGRVPSPLGRRLVPRPFERFRPAEGAVWPLIAALAGMWVDATSLHRVAVNVALALGVVYAVAGLALTWWWLGRRGMGALWRAALVGVATVFLTPFVAAAWVTIGLADVWVAFRDREQTS